jgi:hypothetical protein
LELDDRLNKQNKDKKGEEVPKAIPQTNKKHSTDDTVITAQLTRTVTTDSSFYFYFCFLKKEKKKKKMCRGERENTFWLLRPTALLDDVLHFFRTALA